MFHPMHCLYTIIYVRTRYPTGFMGLQMCPKLWTGVATRKPHPARKTGGGGGGCGLREIVYEGAIIMIPSAFFRYSRKP